MTPAIAGPTRRRSWDFAYGVAFAAGIAVLLVAEAVPLERFFLTWLTRALAGGLVVFASGFAPEARAPWNPPETATGLQHGGPTFSRWPGSR